MSKRRRVLRNRQSEALAEKKVQPAPAKARTKKKTTAKSSAKKTTSSSAKSK